jgi:hypothetical protein
MCEGVSLIAMATNPHHLVTHPPVVMATEEHHMVTYCLVPKEMSPTLRRVKDLPISYSDCPQFACALISSMSIYAHLQ